MLIHEHPNEDVAEQFILDQFDRQPRNSILLLRSSDAFIVLAELQADDVADVATRILDDSVDQATLYTRYYPKVKRPWYVTARRRHIRRDVLLDVKAFAETTQEREHLPDRSFDAFFTRTHLHVYALYYAAFRLRTHIIETKTSGALYTEKPDASVWDAAPAGASFLSIADNAYLGGVSYHYVDKKDQKAGIIQ